MESLLYLPALPHERSLLQYFVNRHPVKPKDWKMWANRYAESPSIYDEVTEIIGKHILKCDRFDDVMEIAYGIQEMRDFSKTLTL